MSKTKQRFGFQFDVDKSPSASSRVSSMERLTGGIKYDGKLNELSSSVKDLVKDPTPLREKLRSGSDIRTTPSIILRKKGIGV